jgi:uncharacterized protein YraI
MRLLSPHRRWLIALLILITGCTLNNVSVPNETISGAPTVRILAPQPNATYMEGVAVNIQATISNAGKDVDRVEIVIDGATVATLNQPNTTAAASFNVTHGWSAAGVGAHSINVAAYRADGSSSAPATVEITVVAGNGQSVNPTQSSSTTTSATQQTSVGQPTQQQQVAATQSGGQSATAASTTAGATSAATTIPPTPSKPTATFAQGINVRSGPSTAFNPPIGAFVAGQSSEILAINTDGTWYKVQYGSGVGWVFAALAQPSGDIASLPRDPGPPIPTAAPTAIPVTQAPAPTAQPSTSANLVAGIVELNPGQPSCAGTFNIGLDVANLGNQATSGSGTVSVNDVRSADGSSQQTTLGGFPVLQPNQTFRVNMPLTVSTWYNEEHTIILIIDPDNQIPETNDGDNRREVRYTLQKGTCP